MDVVGICRYKHKLQCLRQYVAVYKLVIMRFRYIEPVYQILLLDEMKLDVSKFLLFVVVYKLVIVVFTNKCLGILYLCTNVRCCRT